MSYFLKLKRKLRKKFSMMSIVARYSPIFLVSMVLIYCFSPLNFPSKTKHKASCVGDVQSRGVIVYHHGLDSIGVGKVERENRKTLAKI